MLRATKLLGPNSIFIECREGINTETNQLPVKETVAESSLRCQSTRWLIKAPHLATEDELGRGNPSWRKENRE